MKNKIKKFNKESISFRAVAAVEPNKTALAEGYSRMSSVNLALAGEGLKCDSEALLRCEQILAESE